ncbi:MAG: ABC transporter permease [Candidatus Faecousia sp.]|nr:ABC transporter permease [Bacillota bacterium]MDY4754825.1 ABC transporter permease [Candidatus Faecousia sp.]MDY6159186.1 ABC transporter permease [Candidatus Faecousia sp.]
MLRYTIRRFFELLLTLFLIATATFFLLEAVPGDPLTERADHLPEASRAALYERYGLDKPIMERYVLTMKKMCMGDFGESFVYAGQTVTGLLKTRLPVSARLGIQQMLLGVTVGLLLGIAAAMKRGTWVDYAVVTLSVLFISIPHLIFGLLLQKLFAGTLRWLPTIGWPSGADLWFGGWKYTILPTLTGCFSYIATYARLLKTSMLDVVNQEYVLTAESKGLSQGQIIRRHILRNAFIPVMTQLPMSVAMCITGSFFIESIYAIPGIGQYYVTAVNNQDLSIVLGETVLISILYILVLFVTDILYVVVDPRIQLPGKKHR